MIIQTLTKEQNTSSLIERFKERFLPVPSVGVPNNVGSSMPSPFSWTKLQYATWIEGVKREFKVGDLVTLRQHPKILDQAPFYYKIAYIQEIHYEAKMDFTRQVPKAMGLVIPGTVTPTWRTPDELRHLTQEELKHVNNGIAEEFPEPETGSPINTTS